MKSKKNYKKIGTNNASNNHNNIFRITMFALIIIAVGILIGAISYTLNKIHQQRESIDSVISYNVFNTSIEVTIGSVGLNADTDGLKYGKTTAGNGGTRFLDINTSEDSLVNVYLSGDMSTFLSVDENNFFMKGGESRRIPVYLDVPNGTAVGFYTGKIYVLMTRPDDVVVK